MASFDFLTENGTLPSSVTEEGRSHLPSSQGNLNRRSLSVFSRKGVESPVQTTQALVTSSLFSTLGATPVVPRAAIAPRPKKWRLGSNAQKRKTEGTLLRMVPKEIPRNNKIMTPLEKAMATSPNDEILRNIGLNPVTDGSQPTSPLVSPIGEDDPKSSVLKRWSSRHNRQGSQDAVIGVWTAGEAQWTTPQPSRRDTGQSSQERSKSVDTSSKSAVAPSKSQRPARPNIRVVIPSTFSRPFSHVPRTSQSAVAPTDRSITISHTIVQDVAFQPVTQSAQAQITHQQRPQRSAAFIPITVSLAEGDESLAAALNRAAEQIAQGDLLVPALSSSGSSTASISDDDDNTSHRSSRSSLTSLASDEETMKEVIEAEDVQAWHKKPNDTSSDRQVHHPKSIDTIRTTNGETQQHPAELEGSPVADQGPRMANLVTLLRSSSNSTMIRRNSSRKANNLAQKLQSREEALSRTPKSEDLPSPTLSQAEMDLELHLTMLTTSDSTSERAFNLTIPEKNVPTPAIPPKSARRTVKQYGAATTAGGRTHRVAKAPLPSKKSSMRLRARPRPLSHISEEADRRINSNQAETVIFRILESLGSFDDLFNTALLNRGFYRIFKRHELSLMRGVLKTMSPAAWEYRETCLPENEEETPTSDERRPDYTPQSYFQNYTCDAYIISALKPLIVERCQSLLRADTIAALKHHDPSVSSRVDDALWRIWTFCRIFGCNRGREDDTIAQLDWLRGGLLAHQESCTSTISASDSFYLSGVLLSASESFGRGNGEGLTAEQLYDMTEMWNCLNHITGAILGRTEQARQYGVYDNTDVRGGDIDGEEAMLEEWHAYLLTLGLGTILDLAHQTLPCLPASSLGPAAVFATARARGLTFWDPPRLPNSRSTFLQNAVSTLYEERVCEAFTPLATRNASIRELRRSRIAPVPRGERVKRQVDGWERVAETIPEGSSTTARSVSSIAGDSIHSTRIVSAPAGFPAAGFHPAYSQMHRSLTTMPSRKPPPPPPGRSVPAPPQPQHEMQHSISSFSAFTLPTPPPYNSAATAQHPSQALYVSSPLNHTDPTLTADRAIFRIVEMGFTAEQARGALKITDLGDGLSLERAVEFLVRWEGGN